MTVSQQCQADAKHYQLFATADIRYATVVDVLIRFRSLIFFAFNAFPSTTVNVVVIVIDRSQSNRRLPENRILIGQRTRRPGTAAV